MEFFPKPSRYSLVWKSTCLFSHHFVERHRRIYVVAPVGWGFWYFEQFVGWMDLCTTSRSKNPNSQLFQVKWQALHRCSSCYWSIGWVSSRGNPSKSRFPCFPTIWCLATSRNCQQNLNWRISCGSRTTAIIAAWVNFFSLVGESHSNRSALLPEISTGAAIMVLIRLFVRKRSISL